MSYYILDFNRPITKAVGKPHWGYPFDDFYDARYGNITKIQISFARSSSFGGAFRNAVVMHSLRTECVNILI